MCVYYWSSRIPFPNPNAPSCACGPVRRPLCQITAAAWCQKQDACRQRAGNCWNPSAQSDASWRGLQTNDGAHRKWRLERGNRRSHLCMPPVPFLISPSLLRNARPRKAGPRQPLHRLLSLAGTKRRITSSSTLLQLCPLRKPPQAKRCSWALPGQG